MIIYFDKYVNIHLTASVVPFDSFFFFCKICIFLLKGTTHILTTLLIVHSDIAVHRTTSTDASLSQQLCPLRMSVCIKPG